LYDHVTAVADWGAGSRVLEDGSVRVGNVESKVTPVNMIQNKGTRENFISVNPTFPKLPRKDAAKPPAV
jgi:hypothetical protein